VQFIILNSLQDWDLRQAKADRHWHVNSIELSLKKTADLMQKLIGVHSGA